MNAHAKRFNQKLADWLVFYNSQRPHHSLGQTSLSFLLKHQPECQKQWTIHHVYQPVRSPYNSRFVGA